MVIKPHSGAHRFLGIFHHLYRPHHTHNHIPGGFRRGITVEVGYPKKRDREDQATFDQRLFKMFATSPRNKGRETQKTRLRLPQPLFKPGMFLCAKVLDFDKKRGVYRLEYQHGPYFNGQVPSGRKHLAYKNQPKTKFILEDVKDDENISVDMRDNYNSHLPVFIVVMSFLQSFAFL